MPGVDADSISPRARTRDNDCLQHASLNSTRNLGHDSDAYVPGALHLRSPGMVANTALPTLGFKEIANTLPCDQSLFNRSDWGLAPKASRAESRGEECRD